MEALTEAYIGCALWSSHDTVDGEHIMLDSGDYELSEATRAYLTQKAESFYNANQSLIEDFMAEFDTDLGQVGHSLWLSQNGHGAGFFDFRLYGRVNGLGDQLHALARNDETNLYIGDDGEIHHV